VAFPDVANVGTHNARSRHVEPRVATLLAPIDQEVRMSAEQAPIDPNRLAPDQAAKILSAAAKIHIPVEQILEDRTHGAPCNADGTINLMHYAAWLLKEMGRGSD
jgi:hypothetical protein